MKFARLEFIYALPILWLVVGVMLAWARARRQAQLRKFVGNDLTGWADTGASRVRRLWDQALWVLAMSAILVTLARPMIFERSERSELQGAPYLIALDASRSMLAGDVRPSRYSAATNALDRLFAESQSDRIGLITFSGVAYLNAPLTFDVAALRTILGYIDPNALVDPGSSLASALDRADRFFTSNALPVRVMILISDGEDLDPQTLALARRLHTEHQLVVHTIGVGTTAGTSIPAQRAGTVTNSVGLQVITRLDENNLRRIANATGGRYYRLGSNGEGLLRLRSEVLQPLAQKAERDDWQNYREVYWAPLALAIAALIAKLLLGADRFVRRRVLPSILKAKS